MKDKGTLVVISGFSGAGKGTVSKALVEKFGYSLSVSATTRQPREGEQDGREYYFKSEDDFLRLIDYNGFIEYAQYVDHYYGLKSSIQKRFCYLLLHHLLMYLRTGLSDVEQRPRK